MFLSLNNLTDFIKTTDSGLQKEVEEGDYNGLVEVMGHLFAVRERQQTTDEMFEPLKQTIELLKTYDQEMPDEVHVQLQVGSIYVLCVLSFLALSETIANNSKKHFDTIANQ